MRSVSAGTSNRPHCARALLDRRATLNAIPRKAGHMVPPPLLRSNVADTPLLVFACLLHSFTGLQDVCAARGIRTRGQTGKPYHYYMISAWSRADTDRDKAERHHVLRAEDIVERVFHGRLHLQYSLACARKRHGSQKSVGGCFLRHGRDAVPHRQGASDRWAHELNCWCRRLSAECNSKVGRVACGFEAARWCSRRRNSQMAAWRALYFDTSIT